VRVTIKRSLLVVLEASMITFHRHRSEAYRS
jgi:hypothetical protein